MILTPSPLQRPALRTAAAHLPRAALPVRATMPSATCTTSTGACSGSTRWSNAKSSR